MIHKEYRKAFIVSLLGFIFNSVLALWAYSTGHIKTIDDVMVYGIGIVIFGFSSLLFFRKSRKTVHTKEIGNGKLRDEKIITFRKKVGVYKTFFIYSTEGAVLGTVQPANNNLLDFLMSVFESNLAGLLPVKKVIKDEDGNEIAKFKGNSLSLKPIVIYINNKETAILKISSSKSIFNYHFTLTYKNQDYESKTDALHGDIEFNDIMKLESFKTSLNQSKVFKDLTVKNIILHGESDSDEWQLGIALGAIMFYLIDK